MENREVENQGIMPKGENIVMKKAEGKINGEVEKEVRELKTMVSALADRYEELKAKNVDLKTALEGERKTSEILRQKVMELVNENDKLQGTGNVLRSENKKLKTENEELKKSKDDSATSAYIKELESRLWERDNEILKLKDENKKLKKDDEIATILLNEVSDRLLERNEELYELKKEKNNNSDEEIKKLKNIILAYKTENNLLKSKLESLNNPKSLMELYYETIWKILS